MTPRRSALAAFVSILLVATAIASLWLMASAGVFSTGDATLPGAPDPVGGGPVAVETPSVGGLAAAGNAQVSQPRDPFAPLIEETTTTAGEGDGSATTTAGGDGATTTTTGDGASGTTAPSDSTTTTLGDTPAGTRVVLLEINEVDGVKKATLTVDGETFVVGVGETFATNFKVVSLAQNSGVFTFGDSAFTLSVGQSIVK